MNLTRQNVLKIVWYFNLWVFISIFFTWIGAGNWGLLSFLSFPGYFLWKSFSLMAFYPNIYWTVMVYRTLDNKLTKSFLFSWHYSILVFLTASLFFRFLFSSSLDAPVLSFLAGIFGVWGGIILTFLFMIVEVIAYFQLKPFILGWKEKKENLSLDREEESSLDDSLNLYEEEGLSLDKEEEEQLVQDLLSFKEEKKSTFEQQKIFMKEKEEKNPSELEGEIEEEKEEVFFIPLSQKSDREEEIFNSDFITLPSFPLGEEDPIVIRGEFESDVEGTSSIATEAFSLPTTKQYNLKGFFSDAQPIIHYEVTEDNKKEAVILKTTLAEFNIDCEVVGIYRGPVVTTFEILPAQGIKLSRITSLADNIALRLAAPRIRILAPIPGKEAVGIELPNKKRDLVTLGELFSSAIYEDNSMSLPVALGKNVMGDVRVFDLARAPHLLIAGATGAGKSVCLNTLIVSLLYAKTPQELKLIMIDPKIVELKFFNDIPHLITPVITESRKALQVMQWCVSEMERRYHLLDSVGARDITSFNKKVKESNLALDPFPYMVIIMDEFADLMMLQGKELEALIARLAAMSRAVGIHLVLATQRPSVDVITGIIKANFPSRIAFMVSSKMDSRIILDTMGAEQLLGKGDMLVSVPWLPYPERIQGAFLSESDVEGFVDKVKTFGEPEYLDEEIFDESSDFEDDLGEDDPLYERAIEIVITDKKASASYLQRRLKIGYNRAARFIEKMESQGIVGPQQGSKPRDIYR